MWEEYVAPNWLQNTEKKRKHEIKSGTQSNFLYYLGEKCESEIHDPIFFLKLKVIGAATENTKNSITLTK